MALSIVDLIAVSINNPTMEINNPVIVGKVALAIPEAISLALPVPVMAIISKTSIIPVTVPRRPSKGPKRQTKKEQDEQAVNTFLASPAWEGYLSARISAEVDKQSKSAKLDRVYKKAEQVMKDFALLGDGNPEQFAEEEDCLVTYLGKMVQLQLKRKRQLSAASNMAEINAAYSRIKHAPLQRIV